MINAIIVDDEPHCTEHLERVLKQLATDKVRLLGTFETVDQGVAAVDELKPDLLFLDIQLRDKTGFDLLRQIDPIQLSVIFTTAYDQYAVQAFKFSAIDYLLKPVDGDELMASLNRVSVSLDKKAVAARYEILAQHLNQTPAAQTKIALPSMEGWDFVPIADIVRCQAQGNYTLFFIQGEKQLLVSQTLKGYEKLLETHGFFRVHHTHLINLARVIKYNKSGSATMDDGSAVDVSTRRKEAFLSKMAARNR
jgi:two-component system, LytTR family, response regulator